MAETAEGTGLGLAIAEQISELMEEIIGVSSELGKGANFWFAFKADVSEKKEKETLQENTVNINKDKFDLKVLLADDKNVNLIVARSMLMKFDCVPETGVNSLQAVEKFAEGKYGLILMDIQIQEIDVQATTKIKPGSKHVPPIITLTANTMEGDKEKSFDLGDDYLAKPITLKSLKELLNRWFPD